MKKLIEAAKNTEQFIHHFGTCPANDERRECSCGADKAIETLNIAIAEAESESEIVHQAVGFVEKEDHMRDRRNGDVIWLQPAYSQLKDGDLLFTHPAPQSQLTDDKIREVIESYLFGSNYICEHEGAYLEPDTNALVCRQCDDMPDIDDAIPCIIKAFRAIESKLRGES